MESKQTKILVYSAIAVSTLLVGTAIFLFIKKNSFRKRLIKEAMSEWKYWKFGKTKESSSEIYPKLKSYWDSIGWSESDWHPNGTAWSAAFISYVMRKANAGYDFKYSSSHSKYIRDAVKNRKQKNSNPFKAYKTNEKKVEVGDLVCYSRQSGVNYDTESSYESHCDIVIKANKNEAEVIGGNVGNTVGKKTVKLKNGYINDSSNDWFTIIKTS